MHSILKHLRFQYFRIRRALILRWRSYTASLPEGLSRSKLASDIPWLIPVSPELDQAFRRLYADLNKSPDFSLLINEFLPRLGETILRYLDSIPKSVVTHAQIFNNLTPIWNSMLSNQQHQAAQTFWQSILRHVRAWEGSLKSRIHKGSIFYYWGGTAIFQGEHDKGFLLMHSAYEEDRLTYREERPNTPAAKFVSLDFHSGDQLYRSHALMLADFIEDFLGPYRLLSVTHLSRDDVRYSFLEKVGDLSITFAFTHALARLNALEIYLLHSVPSAFSDNYLLNLLFDLVLVIDSALKEKIPGTSNYSMLMVALSQASGFQLTQSEVQHDIKLSASTDFGNTLNALLDHVYRTSSGRQLPELECSLAISYCLRNRAAHSVTSSPVITLRFSQILQSVFNVFFLLIETYYM